MFVFASSKQDKKESFVCLSVTLKSSLYSLSWHKTHLNYPRLIKMPAMRENPGSIFCVNMHCKKMFLFLRKSLNFYALLACTERLFLNLKRRENKIYSCLLRCAICCCFLLFQRDFSPSFCIFSFVMLQFVHLQGWLLGI